jgi:hypothetical protein
MGKYRLIFVFNQLNMFMISLNGFFFFPNGFFIAQRNVGSRVIANQMINTLRGRTKVN